VGAAAGQEREMINPLRSEAEAYRFLLLTVGFFAAIAIAALALGKWVGLAVFALLTLAGLTYVVRARNTEPRQAVPSRRGRENERRILVIANETVGGGPLREEIRRRSEGYDEHVLVICPALNSPLRRWASDEDGARAQAQERLNASLTRLRAAGVDAKGEVGDGDPLQAMEDALRLFGADEIIISTHPEGRSHWLERGIVESARERFTVPITHVVVDLEAEHEEVR
jgi:nucleotide-binding universal stress UspA family protein